MKKTEIAVRSRCSECMAPVRAFDGTTGTLRCAWCGHQEKSEDEAHYMRWRRDLTPTGT